MAEQARIILVWLLAWVVPTIVFAIISLFLLGHPLRKSERARLFLDLLLQALNSGEDIEDFILRLAETREKALGVFFYLMAARIEGGETFEQAIRKSRGVLPQPAVGILLAGMETGRLREATLAARRFVDDKHSAVFSATNYVMVLLLTLAPPVSLMPLWFSIYIWPKFQAIFNDLFEGSAPPVTHGLFNSFPLIVAGQSSVLFISVFLVLLYLGAHNAFGWSRRLFGPLVDQISWAVPWKRKRLQRAFSMTLSLMLDAGATEDKALEVAGAGSGNRIIRRMAARIKGQLQQGTPLPEALKRIEGSPELKWSLSNVLKQGRGFFSALDAWHETLEAEAFRTEQTASQLFSSVAVVCVGAVIGVMVGSVFMLLRQVTLEGVLW